MAQTGSNPIFNVPTVFFASGDVTSAFEDDLVFTAFGPNPDGGSFFRLSGAGSVVFSISVTGTMGDLAQSNIAAIADNAGGVVTVIANGDALPPATFNYNGTNPVVHQVIETSPIPIIFDTVLSIEMSLTASTSVNCPDTKTCFAWHGGAQSDFGNTAQVTGLALFDANGQPVTDFIVDSASGADWGPGGVTTTVTPEPSSYLFAYSISCICKAIVFPSRLLPKRIR